MHALFETAQRFFGSFFDKQNYEFLEYINNIIKRRAISEERRYRHIEKLLKTHKDYDLNQNMSKTLPLHNACKYKKIEIVKLLLNYGADINAKSICYDYPKFFMAHPIQFAFIALGNEENNKTDAFNMINLLLENGSKLHNVPIMPFLVIGAIVSMYFKINMLEKFVGCGANINEVKNANNFLMTVLRDRTHCSKFLLSCLIKAGINLNYVNARKHTPLLIAINYNPQFVPYLLAKGAKVHAEHTRWYLYAAIQSNPGIIRPLLEHGMRATTALYVLLNEILCDRYLTVKRKWVQKCFFLLLEYGANINQLQYLKAPKYPAQTSSLRLELIKLMLDRGADRVISEALNDKAHKKYHDKKLVRVIKRYQPSGAGASLLSLKEICVKTFFKKHIPFDKHKLPKDLVNLLQGIGERPDTRLLQ